MVAVDLRAPGAELVVKDSLLVGGRHPLLDVHTTSAKTPMALHLDRSTLVAGQHALRIHAGTGTDKQTPVEWLSLDSLVSRYGTDNGGEMVELKEGAVIEGMQWTAVNCVYAGWQTLLRYGGGGRIACSDTKQWRE